MNYNFLDSSIDVENFVLPSSKNITPILLKNNNLEVVKALKFLSSTNKILNVHGFLGTGKRQFINYFSEFIAKDVVKLNYYCKAATVCDDIQIALINYLENNNLAPNFNVSMKIVTLSTKLMQYISSLKRPILIILHSFDDILDENKKNVIEFIKQLEQFDNIKLVFSTKAMQIELFDDLKFSKIFLKGLNKKLFKEYLTQNNVEATDTVIEDFYKYTRGYYYYTALSIKIMQSMDITLMDFLQRFAAAKKGFDYYLGTEYLNLVPATIRNFFWFLRTVRHGLSFNALSLLELYDDFSVEYLKANLMIFVENEVIYVQDYFLQNIDISIPTKTEIKLHKYIINIYEKQLKEPTSSRVIPISRQALRAEIEYHNQCIIEIESGKNRFIQIDNDNDVESEIDDNTENSNSTVMSENERFSSEIAEKMKAIDELLKVLDYEKIDSFTLVEVRFKLARLYKIQKNYHKAEHFYSLVEVYYKHHNEIINLNYLYYEITDLYFLMYKHERAIETIKKVIYSVDTPKYLLLLACVLLGNIYSSLNKTDEAFEYYHKAVETIDEYTEEHILAELYFKYALAYDDRGNENKAFEYYDKCINLKQENPYKSLALANIASCYYDNDNYSDAKDCFLKAYKIEKKNNNFDGIYYSASFLAKICKKMKTNDVLEYLKEAKQCAEFINEDFYLLESSIALGDFYYNDANNTQEALDEYCNARKIAKKLGSSIEIAKIEQRIDDMKLRMDTAIFKEIEKKYE